MIDRKPSARESHRGDLGPWLWMTEGGKSIGGGDETAAALANGKLEQWLIAVQALPGPPQADGKDPPPSSSPERGQGGPGSGRREEAEGGKPQDVEEEKEKEEEDEEELGKGRQQLDDEEEDKEEAPAPVPPPVDNGKDWEKKEVAERNAGLDEKPL